MEKINIKYTQKKTSHVLISRANYRASRLVQIVLVNKLFYFHEVEDEQNRGKKYYWYIHEQECTEALQKVHIVYPSLLGNEEDAAMLGVQLMHDADLTHQLVFASPSAFP